MQSLLFLSFFFFLPHLFYFFLSSHHYRGMLPRYTQSHPLPLLILLRVDSIIMPVCMHSHGVASYVVCRGNKERQVEIWQNDRLETKLTEELNESQQKTTAIIKARLVSLHDLHLGRHPCRQLHTESRYFSIFSEDCSQVPVPPGSRTEMPGLQRQLVIIMVSACPAPTKYEELVDLFSSFCACPAIVHMETARGIRHFRILYLTQDYSGLLINTSALPCSSG